MGTVKKAAEFGSRYLGPVNNKPEKLVKQPLSYYYGDTANVVESKAVVKPCAQYSAFLECGSACSLGFKHAQGRNPNESRYL